MKGEFSYALPRFPPPVIGASYAMHGSRLLICGGESEDGAILNTCYFLDQPENGQNDNGTNPQDLKYWIWRKFQNNMNVKRKETAIAALGSKLWIIGGLTSIESNGLVFENIDKTTEVFDFDTSTWDYEIQLDFGLAGHCAIKVHLSKVKLKIDM